MSNLNTPTDAQLHQTWTDYAPENTVQCSRCPGDSEPLDREVLAPPHVSAAECDVHGWFQIILFDGEETQHFKDDTLTLGEVENMAAEELTAEERDAAKRGAIHEAEGTGQSHRFFLAKHLLAKLYIHRADAISDQEHDSIAEHGAANAAEDAYEAAQNTQSA
jgi:hypothetical protein